MTCHLVLGRIVLLAIAASSVATTGPQADTPGRLAAAPGHCDYKVMIWYRRDRPLDTFKYQAYDVRKGQYTPAVDAWVQLLRTRYTTYDVTVREVDLAREQGETESLKVGSVIKRELMVAAALEGVVLGAGAPGFPLPTIAPRSGPTALSGMTNRSPAMGSNPGGSNSLNPPGPSFPFPMPYPRPHP